MHYKFLIQTKQDNLSGNLSKCQIFLCVIFFFNKKRLLYHAKII